MATNLVVTHVWVASLDGKPEEIAVNIGRRPPLHGDFWPRARPADAHAAEEICILFRQVERVPGILRRRAV